MEKRNDGHHENIEAVLNFMMHLLDDKGGGPAQSVHKLYEEQLLLPSVQDLHNLCHLLKQYHKYLEKINGIVTD